MDIPLRSKEELRALVRDAVAGHVLFDGQVPNDLLGSVFMPLMFGALAYPVAAPELPEEPEKPAPVRRRPSRPAPKVDEALRARRVEAAKKARTELEEGEFRVRWKDAEPDILVVLRENVRLAEAEFEEHLREA